MAFCRPVNTFASEIGVESGSVTLESLTLRMASGEWGTLLLHMEPAAPQARLPAGRPVDINVPLMRAAPGRPARHAR